LVGFPSHRVTTRATSCSGAEPRDYTTRVPAPSRTAGHDHHGRRRNAHPARSAYRNEHTVPDQPTRWPRTRAWSACVSPLHTDGSARVCEEQPRSSNITSDQPRSLLSGLNPGGARKSVGERACCLIKNGVNSLSLPRGFFIWQRDHSPTLCRFSPRFKMRFATHRVASVGIARGASTGSPR
jgi:hypothetical protein